MPDCVTPNLPLDGITMGSVDMGTPNRSHNSPDHRSARMSNSIVRLALVTSVAWTSPPVRFQISQESMVPSASSSSTGISRLDNSHSNLVAEKYGSSTSPVVSRTSGKWPAARNASQRSAVRLSCQTIAVPYGFPVRRFQATTVPRWLVMPIAATTSRPTSVVTSFNVACTTAQISSASCSTQPGRGYSCENSRYDDGAVDEAVFPTSAKIARLRTPVV